ncbi:MAG: DUF6249 domain-containing protein [bacterium]
MSGELLAAVIVSIVFFSIVTIVKIVADNSVRRKLIDKEMVNEGVKYLYAHTFANQVPASLKWGMVLIAVGLAIFIAQFFPYTISDEATIGVMFVMGGLALILYYFIAKRMLKRSEEMNGPK